MTTEFFRPGITGLFGVGADVLSETLSPKNVLKTCHHVGQMTGWQVEDHCWAKWPTKYHWVRFAHWDTHVIALYQRR